MRRRLLRSTLSVAITAVVLLGLPLAWVGAQLIRDTAQERVQREAQSIGTALDDRLDHGEPVDRAVLRRFAPHGEQVVLRQPGKPDVSVGPDYGVSGISASVPTGVGGRVLVAGSRDDVRLRVTEAGALVAGLALMAIGVAVGLALLQARRLALPLVDLAVAAERLGSGDARPSNRRYGVPELDRVADVLDRSAVRLARLIASEREFATAASHQLRTPLTALSIRLEEIIAASDQRPVREEAVAALAQAERLAGVVDQLLQRARTNRSGTAEDIDVGQIVRQQAQEYEPAFRRAGRRISVEAPASLQARATPGGLAQVVATLLDNALAHGAGTVSLRARDEADYAVVEVADEGDGVPPDLAPHIFEPRVSGGEGTGLGLALARAFVEGDGGRLQLVRGQPPIFAVFLPRREERGLTVVG